MLTISDMCTFLLQKMALNSMMVLNGILITTTRKSTRH